MNPFSRPLSVSFCVHLWLISGDAAIGELIAEAMAKEDPEFLEALIRHLSASVPQAVLVSRQSSLPEFTIKLQAFTALRLPQSKTQNVYQPCLTNF